MHWIRSGSEVRLELLVGHVAKAQTFQGGLEGGLRLQRGKIDTVGVFLWVGRCGQLGGQREQLLPGQPLALLRHQTSLDDCFQGIIVLWFELRHSGLCPSCELIQGVSIKGGALVPELVQCCPKRPDVTLRSVRLLLQYLRRHVVRSPQVFHHHLLWPIHHLGKAKVDELGNSLLHHDVLRFNVPVDHVVLGKMFQAFDDPCSHLVHLLSVGDHWLGLAVLGHKVDVVFGLEDLVNLEGVGVQGQVFQDNHLVLQGKESLGDQGFEVDDPDGHSFVVQDGGAQIDRGGAALPHNVVGAIGIVVNLLDKGSLEDHNVNSSGLIFYGLEITSLKNYPGGQSQRSVLWRW